MIISLIGRLVRDVEVREVGSDKKKVFNNALAIRSGKDKTTFIDVVAWEGTAELIGKYYKKGFEMLAQGELINKVIKKNDVEFTTVSLLIKSVIFTNGNHRETEDTSDFEEIFDIL